jgi:hypothetical protein
MHTINIAFTRNNLKHRLLRPKSTSARYTRERQQTLTSRVPLNWVEGTSYDNLTPQPLTPSFIGDTSFAQLLSSRNVLLCLRTLPSGLGRTARKVSPVHLQNFQEFDLEIQQRHLEPPFHKYLMHSGDCVKLY